MIPRVPGELLRVEYDETVAEGEFRQSIRGAEIYVHCESCLRELVATANHRITARSAFLGVLITQAVKLDVRPPEGQ